jgi:hypothetical protein
MTAEEAAWDATGAPFALAEVPKPTDIHQEDPTTVPLHRLTVEQLLADLTTYTDVMVELRSFIDYLSEYRSDAVRAVLGRAHDNLEEAAGTIRALTTAHMRVEYGIRWDEHLDGYADISRPFTTRADAEAALRDCNGTGTVVSRAVFTTEWVNA